MGSQNLLRLHRHIVTLCLTEQAIQILFQIQYQKRLLMDLVILRELAKVKRMVQMRATVEEEA